MATVSGFFRWLRSLRTLNAQRDALEAHAAEIRDLASRAAQGLRRIDALEAQSTLQQQRHDRLAHDAEMLSTQAGQEREQALAVRDGIRREMTSLMTRLDELARSSRNLETTTESLRARVAGIAPDFPSLSGLAAGDSAAWFHSAVEGTFRGPVEEIRERLRVYVPYLAKIPAEARHLAALDLGCGRGEWLELLRDERVTAIGVDANPVSVERCIAQGSRAVRSDAIEYLRQQPADSICLVSAFHVAEHLPVESLLDMLFETRRVLAPDGLLILETPNPDNVRVASNSFYLDPTHRHPLPTPLLRMIVEFAKFDVIETLALQPDDAMRRIAETERWPATLTELMAGPRDTGIVARKPAASPARP